MIASLVAASVLSSLEVGVCLSSAPVVVFEHAYPVFGDIIDEEALPATWASAAKSRLMALSLPVVSGESFTREDVIDMVSNRAPGLLIIDCDPASGEMVFNRMEQASVVSDDVTLQAVRRAGKWDEAVLQIVSGSIRIQRPVTLLEDLHGQSRVFVMTADDEVLSVPVDGRFMRLVYP